MRRHRRKTYSGFSRPDTDQITKAGCRASRVKALTATPDLHEAARDRVTVTSRNEPAVRTPATIFGVQTSWNNPRR
jgi:hypothetical protein